MRTSLLLAAVIGAGVLASTAPADAAVSDCPVNTVCGWTNTTQTGLPAWTVPVSSLHAGFAIPADTASVYNRTVFVACVFNQKGTFIHSFQPLHGGVLGPDDTTIHDC
jgi:peptidase inhibitor family I36